MLTLNGYSAWIVCDGKPVPEYETHVDTKNKRVRCWIPGDEGKIFSVHWKDLGTGVTSMGFIALDGSTFPGRFLMGRGETQRDGVRTGPTTQRPFMFAPVKEADRKTHKDHGSIVLKIMQVKKNGPVKNDGVVPLPKPSSLPHQDVRVGFGPECPTWEKHPTTWSVEPVNKANPRDHISFVFRYRSRAWLREQGILADSPCFKHEKLNSDASTPPSGLDISSTSRLNASATPPSDHNISPALRPGFLASSPSIPDEHSECVPESQGEMPPDSPPPTTSRTPPLHDTP
ncbi:hypothetical protein PUNSTDRAFT_127047, partial [Punctularia strigosozonata HHB-11173 SS5]|uniref:uncharacterized protein n=1 Tax=Punctularia strigosozonata (strain HHB-11173) TaxID=741275 RepID=UPI0004416C2F